jgi:hypothetical protein
MVVCSGALSALASIGEKAAKAASPGKTSEANKTLEVAGVGLG